MNNEITHIKTKNTRYLGVYESSVIRSDLIQSYDIGIINKIKELEITTIIDLRSEGEVTRTPCSLANHDFFEYYNIPLHKNGVLPLDCEKTAGFYFQMSLNLHSVNTIFHLIMNADKKVLICCRSGKDRTGIISALLLMLSGFSDEYIVDDYVLSAKNLSAEIDEWTKNHSEYSNEAVTPKSEYILKFLCVFRREFMSIENYCIQCGLTQDEIELLQRKLCNKIM